LFLITGLSATASIRAPSYISMRTNAGGSPRRLSIQNSWTVLVLGGVELHRTRAQHRLTLGAARSQREPPLRRGVVGAGHEPDAAVLEAVDPGPDIHQLSRKLRSPRGIRSAGGAAARLPYARTT
jgi:hypothetical protein